jgi:hypothetical protein
MPPSSPVRPVHAPPAHGSAQSLNLVFRELLQNADDARAERVEIRFETQAFLDAGDAAPAEDEGPAPDLRTVQVCELCCVVVEYALT